MDRSISDIRQQFLPLNTGNTAPPSPEAAFAGSGLTSIWPQRRGRPETPVFLHHCLLGQQGSEVFRVQDNLDWITPAIYIDTVFIPFDVPLPSLCPQFSFEVIGLKDPLMAGKTGISLGN